MKLCQPLSSSGFDQLSGDLIDGIAEAVASPPDPAARSTAICSLVREVYETLEWLHGAGVQNEELASLGRLLQEAQAHQQRMSKLRGDGSRAPLVSVT